MIAGHFGLGARLNPLQELLDNRECLLTTELVREATAAALHALRHDRRMERLDFEQAKDVAMSLIHVPDVRVLSRYTLPLLPGWVEDALALQRHAFNRLLFEVMDEEALRVEGIQELSRVAVARGSQMRVTEVPFRLHLYDRRFALVAVDFVDSRAGALVIREPGLLASFTELHARMWQRGRKWDGAAGSAVDLADVLSELLQGATDESGAQHLHISLRTYRRKVKDLLELLGAASRFQAGAVAEHRRYLDLVRPAHLPTHPPPRRRQTWAEALDELCTSGLAGFQRQDGQKLPQGEAP